jgi:hypothetical protein
MQKRLLFFAALAALWAAPADSKASSFGLTYSRQCSSCSFCVRPYNAFSSVSCGVVSNCGQGGCGWGCGWGCGPKGFNNFGPKCCGFGGCGHGWGHGCGRKIFCCRLRGRLFGTKDYPIFPEDDEAGAGAFGCVGEEVAFFGTPAIRNGYNPGCHMAWAWNTPPVNVPGHTPPPGPCVQPPNASCTNVWLPPQPCPGMYGMQGYGYYPMPYYPRMPYPQQQPQQQPQPQPQRGVAPVSYQQYDGQGNYWYPGYTGEGYQGWYVPGYYYGQ